METKLTLWAVIQYIYYNPSWAPLYFEAIFVATLERDNEILHKHNPKDNDTPGSPSQKVWLTQSQALLQQTYELQF